MLHDSAWRGHAKFVAFSKLYNVQIKLFSFLGLGESITRVSTAKWKKLAIFRILILRFDSKNNEDDVNLF